MPFHSKLLRKNSQAPAASILFVLLKCILDLAQSRFGPEEGLQNLNVCLPDDDGGPFSSFWASVQELTLLVQYCSFSSEKWHRSKGVHLNREMYWMHREDGKLHSAIMDFYKDHFFLSLSISICMKWRYGLRVIKCKCAKNIYYFSSL